MSQWQQFFPLATRDRVVGCLGCGARARQKDTEPLLLSMGQFWVPSISSVAAAATTAVANGQDHASMGRVTTAAISLLQDKHTSLDSTVAQSLSLQPADSKPATTAAAVAVYYGGQEVDALTRHSLQLHSITARVHYERLMAWTSQLSFPSDTQRMTKGYFEAPGGLQQGVCECFFWVSTTICAVVVHMHQNPHCA